MLALKSKDLARVAKRAAHGPVTPAAAAVASAYVSQMIVDGPHGKRTGVALFLIAGGGVMATGEGKLLPSIGVGLAGGSLLTLLSR